ncbi:MAG: DUF4279 domain-containing protein [Planctomycetes bacterium]|nr:DUF4279 domain-containing protein [Planctomycetota bacterium]MCB9935928.1 DUF4279 domain-containing protein [Planctomycetota bacterium]
MAIEQLGIDPLISCELAVVGVKLDLAHVSQLLGADPTSSSLQRPIKLGPDAGKVAWFLKVDAHPTIDLNDVVADLFELLQCNLLNAASILGQLGAAVSVEASVKVRSMRRPLIRLAPAVVKQLADLGAEFTIDWFDPCEYG